MPINFNFSQRYLGGPEMADIGSRGRDSFNLSSAYGMQKQPEPPKFAFGPPAPLGYGGYDVREPEHAWGYPSGLNPSIRQSFDYLARGSAGADELLREGSYGKFRARLEGYAGGRAEENRRLAAEGAASGYSPELLRRQRFARDAEDQASYGAERGGMEGDLAELRAELYKNTGVEFASLNESVRAEILNAYLNAKARQAARASGKNQALGSVAKLAGGVLGSFLGPVGAAAGTALGSSLFGGKTAPVTDYRTSGYS